LKAALSLQKMFFMVLGNTIGIVKAKKVAIEESVTSRNHNTNQKVLIKKG
jgi:hypothetical protein